MGCHFLLQEIFPTQGSNPGLPQSRQTLYHLSHCEEAQCPRVPSNQGLDTSSGGEKIKLKAHKSRKVYLGLASIGAGYVLISSFWQPFTGGQDKKVSQWAEQRYQGRVPLGRLPLGRLTVYRQCLELVINCRLTAQTVHPSNDYSNKHNEKQRRWNQSIWKEINPEYSLEKLMLKLSYNTLATWYKELTCWKRLWWWERLKAKGEGGGRGWDG